MAGARSAVTQPNPPSSRSSCTRALVIIPRSPTITMSLSLNVSLTAWTMAVNAVGSAVLPGKTRTATGRPAGSVSSPYSIWGRPFLPSREYPRRQERPAPDRVRAADRPRRAAGGGAGVPWEQRRPDRVHHHRGYRQGHLQAHGHGDGRRPRDDHQCPGGGFTGNGGVRLGHRAE